ncbi:SAF domain-containing protein [Microbacterium sp. 179-I 3D4 NHS]|uniref:SAF domain-containing protein n=1 Tax=Microbacterium sp. 179-I 3D4 NHS TaxID=3142381 RepID=UPI0039A1DC0C
MTSIPRRHRAPWGDLRFLIGILLVVVSITGVWLLVASADTATPVLQATRTIVEGQPLVSDDFQVAEVALGGLTDDYLAPQQLESGRVAARTIESGELLRSSAAIAADDTRRTTVVVETGTPIPTEVDAGTVVELWTVPVREDGRSHDSPRLLLADAIVGEVTEADGMLSDGSTSVELVVDRAHVAEVLAEITGGSALAIVPVGSRP